MIKGSEVKRRCIVCGGPIKVKGDGYSRGVIPLLKRSANSVTCSKPCSRIYSNTRRSVGMIYADKFNRLKSKIKTVLDSSDKDFN